MIKIIKITLIIFVLTGIMFLSLRGLPGNPDGAQLQKHEWRDDGPFELSPERGRFALTYSLAENHSVYFPVDIARFVIPDLGFKNGNYVSLFAPALSFIVLPGYLVGKSFGFAQVGTFAVVAVFAIANCIFIYQLAKKFGANKIAAALGGIVFLFASPSYSYGVNLYQHHVTTFLVLLSLAILTNHKGFWSTFWLALIYGLGIALDYPNAFLLLPIVIAAGLKTISVVAQRQSIKFNMNLLYIFGIIGIIFPMLFFFWFNKTSYGNPLITLGNPEIVAVKDIDTKGSPIGLSEQDREAGVSTEPNTSGVFTYLETRDIVNGLYILFVSMDRGILIFTPVVLFGILGAMYFQKLNRSENGHLPILIGIIASNLLVYSMWGDPWGGWAFGARYLIPTYAILAILTSLALTKLAKNWLVITIFWALLTYSLFVNTLGALTTSAMPPRVEADALSKVSGKVERYSWDRNWEFINAGNSKSLVFQTWAYNHVSALHYFYIIAGSITLVSTTLIILLTRQKNA